MGSNQEGRVLAYLLIPDVVSPKYPDGLPWYMYPGMGVTAGLHLNNQWTVGSSAVIVKKDDGSATGCYVAVDASDVDELDAIWEKSGEILKSIEE